jgi:hypothetical protein
MQRLKKAFVAELSKGMVSLRAAAQAVGRDPATV